MNFQKQILKAFLLHLKNKARSLQKSGALDGSEDEVLLIYILLEAAARDFRPLNQEGKALRKRLLPFL